LGRFKLNVLNLDRIIASKKAIGRAKDKLVLPVLEDVWKARKVLGGESSDHHEQPARRVRSARPCRTG